jgi:hypothetical protein
LPDEFTELEKRIIKQLFRVDRFEDIFAIRENIQSEEVEAEYQRLFGVTEKEVINAVNSIRVKLGLSQFI